MSLFWIGDKTPPRAGGVRASAGAYEHIVKSLGKDPAAGVGAIPASVATGRLRKYNFPKGAVPSAANVLNLARASERGSMLHWRA
jgi:hypothetical protein